MSAADRAGSTRNPLKYRAVAVLAYVVFRCGVGSLVGISPNPPKFGQSVTY